MRNLHLTFDCMYCSQKLGEDFAKIVAFSEYMNFKKKEEQRKKEKYSFDSRCNAVIHLFIFVEKCQRSSQFLIGTDCWTG